MNERKELTGRKDRSVGWALIALTGICIALLPLAADELLVRRLYMQYLEPESTGGTLVHAERIVEAEYVPGKANVLVIGDSRIGEGFSRRIANSVAQDSHVNFVRLALSGTTPRVWYYVLRHIDPDRNRFVGVYLMVSSLADDDADKLADWDLDNAYLRPILGWKDFFDYPNSFSDKKLAQKARREIAFAGGAIRDDVAAFLGSPVARIEKVALWRRNYPEWLNIYDGRRESVPLATELDRPPEQIGLTPRLHRELKACLEATRIKASAPPRTTHESFMYRSRWFGALLDDYRKTAVDIGIFPVPRGPYHKAFEIPWRLSGSLEQLQHKARLRLVAPEIAMELERPAYFFDSLHLNAKGRIEFTGKLATAIAAIHQPR